MLFNKAMSESLRDLSEFAWKFWYNVCSMTVRPDSAFRSNYEQQQKNSGKLR